MPETLLKLHKTQHTILLHFQLIDDNAIIENPAYYFLFMKTSFSFDNKNVRAPI
jgi:hypothetical protein